MGYALVASAPAARGSDDIDTGGVGVEQDLGIAAFQLRPHVRNLLLERELALPVVGALAQHEGPDDPLERRRGQLPVRYGDRLLLRRAADDMR